MIAEGEGTIIAIGEAERLREERAQLVGLIRGFIVEKRHLERTFLFDLGLHASKNDLKRYGYLLYEIMLYLHDKPDATGNIATNVELLTIANKLFSVPALKQAYLSKEYHDLGNALDCAINPPFIIPDDDPFFVMNFEAQILADRGGNYREKFKQIIIGDARRQVIASLDPGEVLSEEELRKRTALKSRKILSGIGKKTLQKIDARFFTNIIALNAFMAFVTFSIFAKENRNVYIYNHPAILYLIGATIYGDLFTNVLTWILKGIALLMKNKSDLGVNRAYVTLVSVAAAIIAKTWADKEPDLGDKAIKASSVYLGITLLALVEVISPLFNNIKIGSHTLPGLFTKKGWWLEEAAYQKKPTAPGRIFMAAALPALIKGVNSISAMSGYPLLKDDNRFLTTWAVTAAVSQVFQLLYFCTSLPFYARKADREKGMQGYDFFQLYGFEKNKFVNSRQAENIWAIWGVTFISIFLDNIASIYPSQRWIPLMNMFLVLIFGPRLGGWFQHNVFCRTEVAGSVNYNYLDYMSGHSISMVGPFGLIENPVQYPDSLEPSTLAAIRNLNDRQHDWKGARKYFGGPQTLHEKIVQVETTKQTGGRLLPFGLRNQAASISNVALFLLVVFYFWTELAKTFLDQDSSTGPGTWTTAVTNLAIMSTVTFLIRGCQWLIASCPLVEKTLIEATAPISRACRFGSSVVKGLWQGKPVGQTLLTAAKKNVFVVPRSQPQCDIDTMVDELWHDEVASQGQPPQPPLPPAVPSLVPALQVTTAVVAYTPRPGGPIMPAPASTRPAPVIHTPIVYTPMRAATAAGGTGAGLPQPRTATSLVPAAQHLARPVPLLAQTTQASVRADSNVDPMLYPRSSGFYSVAPRASSPPRACTAVAPILRGGPITNAYDSHFVVDHYVPRPQSPPMGR
ncbi:MAG: hypothetical protein KBD25_00285 [Rickettsiaceae bacterium]|nr:hypothetical protein [Rickettsiaceae bacterium]